MDTLFILVFAIGLSVGVTKFVHAVFPPPYSQLIAKEADKLAQEELLVDSNFAGGYYYALKNCVQVEVPCKLLWQRRQEIADGFASCRDSSAMCETVRAKYQSSDFSRVFDGGRVTVEVPTHPYSGKIGNVLLDTYAEKENNKLEMLWLWCRNWAVELIALVSLLLALLAYGIISWLDHANAHRKLQVVEVMSGDGANEVLTAPKLQDDEDTRWDSYMESTTMTPEVFALFVENDQKLSVLFKRDQEENWSQDRFNLEYIAVGLADERTAIAMTLVARMREGFDRL
jgi:hypothetical protein